MLLSQARGGLEGQIQQDHTARPSSSVKQNDQSKHSKGVIVVEDDKPVADAPGNRGRTSTREEGDAFTQQSIRSVPHKILRGFASGFELTGHTVMMRTRDHWGQRSTRIVAINALVFRSMVSRATTIW